MSGLDPVRYDSGWGVSFGNWGASAEAPTYVLDGLNHCIQGQRRLVAQYQDKTKMRSLICTMAQGIQRLEDSMQAVLQFGSLDTSFGKTLDGIGELMLLPRNGAEDNTYRVRISARAIAAHCSGTFEEARQILDELLQGMNAVRVTDHFPGVTIFRTYELPQSDGVVDATIVKFGAANGTRIIIEWEIPLSVGSSFGWENDNSALGFAEFGEDPGPAGFWAEGYDGL